MDTPRPLPHRRSGRTGLVLAIGTIASLVVPSAAASADHADVPQSSPEACLALPSETGLSADGESVVILSSTVDEGTCDVVGRIGGRINFNVQAPLSTWNGRYVQIGGGGFCGTIPTKTGGGGSYLSDGSVIGSNDSGHTGALLNAEWAYHNDQAGIDWAYLAEHLNAVTAKAITEVLYGQVPDHSYQIGCSTGGRQTLMSAQRYPEDFDGIVSGAPANRQNHLAVLSQGFRERANHRDDADRSLIIETADSALLAGAVMAQCDAADGIEDGVVNDPRACDFDPASMLCGTAPAGACFTQEQVDVLYLWYDDPRNSTGESLYPGGTPVGNESGWAVNAIIGPGNAFSMGGQFGDQVLRYLAFPEDPPPNYDLYAFDFDTDPPLLDEMGEVYNADDPALMAEFRDRGGKFMLWHGFADPLITPMATIEFYEESLAALGGLDAVQPWYRFFLLPGVGHCSGGTGPGSVDWYTAITEWVEQGVAPASVTASGNGMTRPIYPYPQVATYTGEGDTNDVANFVPVEAPRGRGISIVGLEGAAQPFVADEQAAAPEPEPAPADEPAPTPEPLPATGGGLALTGLAATLVATARRRRTD